MKTSLIFLPLLIFISLSATELQWVDEQIKAIKPPRVGLKSANLAKIKDPFLFTQLTSEKKKKKAIKRKKIYRAKHSPKRYSLKRLHLSMTMNKSAKINGKWYKVDDVIHGYKITDIQLSSVKLKYHKKSYLLSTYTKKTVKFKN